MLSPWFELGRHARAHTAHSFLVHGNTADDVLHEGKFVRPADVIPEIEPLSKAGIIVLFNFRTGIRFASPEMLQPFLALAVKPVWLESGRSAMQSLESYYSANRRSFQEVLFWFDELFKISWRNFADTLTTEELPKISAYFKKYCPEKERKNSPFAVAVIEYQETKTPAGSCGSSCMSDRVSAEFCRDWAQSRDIRENSNIIIHVVESLSDVPPQFRNANSGIIQIKIPIPDRYAYEEILKAFNAQSLLPEVKDAAEEDALSIAEIARIAAGLSVVEVGQILKEAVNSGEKLTGPVLFKRKAQVIEDKLGGMISIEKPPWGWETLGGLDNFVVLAASWASDLKRGDISHIPRGMVLLAGPPGTGKTVAVEVFCHESDIPCVKYRSTMDPFVGVSEKQTYLLADVLLAMAPVTLFIDEIDKKFLSQDNVFHGDSGVRANVQGIWHEFLSDPKIHGKVFIYAATNRPDRIETSLMRAGRVGMVIPFLLPKKEQRPDIWRALICKEKIRFALNGKELDASKILNDEFIAKISGMLDFWWIEDPKGAILRPGPLPSSGENPFDADFRTKIVELTGGEIEVIISLALRPFLPEEDSKKLKFLSPSDRDKLLASRRPKTDAVIIEPEAVIDAVNNFLPHEDIDMYEAQQDLALLSVNDLRCIPHEYHERARRLRVDRALRKTILSKMFSSLD